MRGPEDRGLHKSEGLLRGVKAWCFGDLSSRLSVAIVWGGRIGIAKLLSWVLEGLGFPDPCIILVWVFGVQGVLFEI